MRYTPRGMNLEQKVRFWIGPDRTSGCWQWMGNINSEGYGRLIHERRRRMAHVWSYELFIGPIPEGKQLDHLCRNPACVNPDHLEPVTRKENILRGVGASAINARKQYCPKGHALLGQNLSGTVGHRRCRKCHNRDAMRWWLLRRKNIPKDQIAERLSQLPD